MNARMFQKQLDPSIFIYKCRRIFKTLRQGRLAEKKKWEDIPYVYPQVYCKATFLALLIILIGLSILLFCDTTEIMMNRSLILVINVVWNSCRRIGREKARRMFGQNI